MNEKLKYVIYIFIVLSSYSLFLFGFFPIKLVLPGTAKLDNLTFGQDTLIGYPRQKHERVVLILVDALRADFVYERNSMKFVKHLIHEGKAYNFTLRAHPPTVTLPRIKAITTGSIPGFADVVLNYDSQALQEDNIITQAWSRKKIIFFFGDDTWIKLFPNHFTKSDGTTSFFVTDYTEVDTNVTRHLDTVLSSLDWDLMVLHYLGLDHIGHTVGPSSPLVDPKLQEMDNVVKQVYRVLEKKSGTSVILVCGDHGMSDQGSHGGASEREVFVPAIFLSPSFSQKQGTSRTHSKGLHWSSHRQTLQVDLAPTLSVLLGQPIPNNNLGQILPSTLEHYSDEEKLNVMHINARQMLKLLTANTPDFTQETSYELYQRAVHLHEEYLGAASNHPPSVSSVLHGYETAMDAMATKISSSLTKYDLYSMILGIILLLMLLINELMGLLTVRPGNSSSIHFSSLMFCALSLVGVFGHMTACTNQSLYSTRLCGTHLSSVLLQIAVFLCIQLLAGVFVTTVKLEFNFRKVFPDLVLSRCLVIGTFSHSISLLSSSYVEEEHQFWYFWVMTFYWVSIATTLCHGIHSYRERKLIKFEESKFIQHNEMNKESTEQNYTQLKRKKTCDINRSSHSDDIEPEIASKSKFTNGSNVSQVSNQHRFILDKNLCDLPWREMFQWRPVVAMVMVVLLGRYLRTINQTGNKWLDVPDVGDWLVRPENKSILSLLVPVSLLVIFSLIASGTNLETLLIAMGLLGCYRYRIATKTIYSLAGLHEGDSDLSKGIGEAMFVYMMIFAINMMAVIEYCRQLYKDRSNIQCDQRTKVKMKVIHNLQSSFVLLMVLLFRPHNTIFVAMVVLQERLLWKHFLSMTSLPVPYLALFCWWMGQAVFFQQGNSNSLSTVDVAAGYVGLQEYTPGLVVFLLYCSTYAGPIFWLLTLCKCILHREEIHRTQRTQDRLVDDPMVGCVRVFTLERLFTLSLYCIVVTTQRYHLFVWTVFSPKLLYEAMLTITYALFALVLLLLG